MQFLLPEQLVKVPHQQHKAGNVRAWSGIRAQVYTGTPVLSGGNSSDRHRQILNILLLAPRMVYCMV